MISYFIYVKVISFCWRVRARSQFVLKAVKVIAKGKLDNRFPMMDLTEKTDYQIMQLFVHANLKVEVANKKWRYMIHGEYL